MKARATYHEAEQFELFPQRPSPSRRYAAHVVDGDEQDPTTTLVVDGTRTTEPEKTP